MFMHFSVTQEMMINFMTVLDSMAWAQSFDDKTVFVFVGDANAHHSVWLVSVSPTDQYGHESWCSWFLQSVRLWAAGSLSHSLAGNISDLVMTEVLT